MDMFPTDSNLSSVINSVFLEKSSQYRNNAITFYTDGSKLDKNFPSEASVFSPELNLRITYKLPVESFVFSAEAWAIRVSFHRARHASRRPSRYELTNQNILFHCIICRAISCAMKR